MRFACWITKATDTHSEYVILIAFPVQQWLRERASVLRYTYIASLVCLLTHIPHPKQISKMSVLKTETTSGESCERDVAGLIVQLLSASPNIATFLVTIQRGELQTTTRHHLH
jgi:hypothetical protein